MLDKITKIVQDYKSDDSITIDASTTFESLELDSLDLVQLIMDVEEAFDVSIEVGKDPINNVQELIDVIEKAKG